jgi:hypothetical protein
MSRALYVTCQDCKERLWIGQGEGSFYSGDPEVMEALGKFLFTHETTLTTEHTLNFRDDNSDDAWYADDEWVRIDTNQQEEATKAAGLDKA